MIQRLLFVCCIATTVCLCEALTREEAEAEFSARCNRLYRGDRARCERQYSAICGQRRDNDSARRRLCNAYWTLQETESITISTTRTTLQTTRRAKSTSAQQDDGRDEHNEGREPKPNEALECERWRERPRIKYNCTKEEVEGENPECASWRAERADRQKMRDLSSLLDRRARRRKQQNDMQGFHRAERWRPRWAQRDTRARKQVNELTINERNNNTIYFQGDVDLTKGQVEMIIEDMKTEGGRRKRKVGAEPIYNLWEEMPISYHFGSGLGSGTKNRIREAIRLWEENTCVRWEEDGPKTDRLEFYNDNGCSSFVGRIGGTQQVSINVPGCDTVGIISHEIGHSLGFFHEQARPDASKFVTINYANINPFRYNNFLPVDYHGQKYDYGSVMHYNGYSFALSDRVPSLETNDAHYQYTIGQRVQPSFIDFAQVNDAYCKDSCRGSRISCRRGGYVDPNNCRRCKCPSGFGGDRCETVAYSDCGGTLDVYSTPNFIEQSSTRSEKECIWLLKTKSGSKVSLQFEDAFGFECKETCDESYVELKIGGDWRSTGFRACCQRPTETFKSKDNEIIVIYRVHRGASSGGFRARVWADGAGPAPGSGESTTRITVSTPASTTSTTTQPQPSTTNKPGCQCDKWSAWSVGCTQECGGCGEQTRKRSCNRANCFDLEKRKCNFEPCENGRSFIFANRQFHILVNGCCVGQFRGRDNLCNAGLEGAFTQLVSSFLNRDDRGGGGFLSSLFNRQNGR